MAPNTQSPPLCTSASSHFVAGSAVVDVCLRLLPETFITESQNILSLTTIDDDGPYYKLPCLGCHVALSRVTIDAIHSISATNRAICLLNKLFIRSVDQLGPYAELVDVAWIADEPPCPR